MRILVMTNTFTPHIGGVARSVTAFIDAYRERGHDVLVVAPNFDGQPETEEDVVRLPAIQHFNGSDFSVALPIPGFLHAALETFQPQLIHSHHPFLVGNTALRLAESYSLPHVFTHHTMYEQYTHYVPGDSWALKQFVVRLSTSFANLCDGVFAPSESVAAILQARGVAAPLHILPTGVDSAQFSTGKGTAIRRAHAIPARAFVVGHLGRLAPEKNMPFLAECISLFLHYAPRAHALIAGGGPSQSAMQAIFERAGVDNRVHWPGLLDRTATRKAYAAMDVFAFASRSETQGMVLTEAMACGVPVVALDAPGAREVVIDRLNGRLLNEDSVAAMANALAWVAEQPPDKRDALRAAARNRAQEFSMDRMADRALAVYESLVANAVEDRSEALHTWDRLLAHIRTEYNLLKGVALSEN